MGVFKAVTSTRLYKLKNSIPNLTLLRHTSNSKQNNDETDGDLPEEPTTCCMSGCANCVWVEYAEKLSRYYQNGAEEALKKINEKVTDPNMKAFLLHELRMRKLA